MVKFNNGHRTKTEYRLQNGLSTRSLSAQCLKFLVLKALNNIQKVSLTLKKLPSRSNSCSRNLVRESLGTLCQDETRLGLKTIAGRLITATGVKPLGLSQWQRENFIYMAW